METADLLKNLVKSHCGTIQSKVDPLLTALENSSEDNFSAAHDAAEALKASLQKAVDEGSTYFSGFAASVDFLLKHAKVTNANALTLFVDALKHTVKDMVDSAVTPVHETLDDIGTIARKGTNLTRKVVGVGSGESSCTDIAEGVLDITASAAQTSESVLNLPLRVAAKVVTTALQRFTSGDDNSPLFVIARAIVAAIEAATNADTPLKAASEAFNKSIQKEVATPDEQLIKWSKEMAGIFEAMQANNPSTTCVSHLMVQSLNWIIALNQLVTKYPEDTQLKTVAENVEMAMMAMQIAIDKRYEKASYK